MIFQLAMLVYQRVNSFIFGLVLGCPQKNCRLSPVKPKHDTMHIHGSLIKICGQPDGSASPELDAGWGYTYPSETKCSLVGMMTFPIYGNIKFTFQTTNQWCVRNLNIPITIITDTTQCFGKKLCNWLIIFSIFRRSTEYFCCDDNSANSRSYCSFNPQFVVPSAHFPLWIAQKTLIQQTSCLPMSRTEKAPLATHSPSRTNLENGDEGNHLPSGNLT